VGHQEDEIRIDAEDALGALDGLEVRRVFSGWGFYRRGLLFATAFDGEFRFRFRREGRWHHESVARDLLDRPEELVAAARAVLAKLEAEPAAHPRRRASRPPRRP
jgi:CO/xanthine dehydrogenase Mo-binding subunit